MIDYNTSITYMNKCIRKQIEEQKKMERKMKKPKGRYR